MLLQLSGSALAALVKGLPEALQRQYEYEDPLVRSGKHLMHSPFFKVSSVCVCVRVSACVCVWYDLLWKMVMRTHL